MEPLSLLDSAFVYVPAGEQDQRGVLARWLRQREVERERASKASLIGKILALPDNKRHAG